MHTCTLPFPININQKKKPKKGTKRLGVEPTAESEKTRGGPLKEEASHLPVCVPSIVMETWHSAQAGSLASGLGVVRDCLCAEEAIAAAVTIAGLAAVVVRVNEPEDRCFAPAEAFLKVAAAHGARRLGVRTGHESLEDTSGVQGLTAAGHGDDAEMRCRGGRVGAGPKVATDGAAGVEGGGLVVGEGSGGRYVVPDNLDQREILLGNLLAVGLEVV